ncbi:syntaxin-10-like [Pollicipes pollicipes]|uniref:syntaxin-10-like n=1 Tax=Pollicipes pollicipes TaxID=41117 RepID=UPI00188500AC|nr:syntaxin-10-like [Pollicipes pollicipes]
MEDPFYLVRDDVVKALSKLRGLHQRLNELETVPATAAERTWTESELRNALRSTEWDVEDLQETISIVEKNPKQFKLDAADLQARRSFVKATRDELGLLKERLSLNRAVDCDRTARQELEEADELPPAYNPLLDHASSPEHAITSVPGVGGSGGGGGGGAGGGYSRLREDEPDSPPVVVKVSSVSTLLPLTAGVPCSSCLGAHCAWGLCRGARRDRSLFRCMVDDTVPEVATTQGKLARPLNKVLKVLHLSNERRQWTAIGVLSGLMLAAVLMLFFI